MLGRKTTVPCPYDELSHPSACDELSHPCACNEQTSHPSAAQNKNWRMGSFFLEIAAASHPVRGCWYYLRLTLFNLHQLNNVRKKFILKNIIEMKFYLK